MKLPKPGNVKLPKPGKVKLPKPGKMPGNLKLPAFHMKNGFLKKNLITLIAAAVLIIGTGTAYGTLATREADRGFDPIEGVNQDRYQVLVSGEGYKLSKIQERNYKLQKKQNEVNAAQAAQTAQNNPTTIRTSSGSRVYRTSNYRYRPRTSSSSSYNTTGTVFISTNIYSQKSSKPNWKSGDEFSFMVTAYTYKNGKKTTLSKDNIKVKSDKGTLKHTGSKDGNQQYVLKLDEGLHKITVTAKDKNSKRESKNTYIITVGKGTSHNNTKPTTKPTKPDNTDPTNPTDPTDPTGSTDPTDPVEETVTVTVSGDVIGDIISKDYTITEGTTAYDLLQTISNESDDVTIKFDGKSIKTIEGDINDFKLEREDEEIIKIYKEEKDIADEDDVTPDDEAYNIWCDKKEEKVNNAHKLGKDYPFSKSHWDYKPDQIIKAPSANIDLKFELY